METLPAFPAVIMLLIATPLMLGRAAVYGAYLGVARNAFDGARLVIQYLVDHVRRGF